MYVAPGNEKEATFKDFGNNNYKSKTNIKNLEFTRCVQVRAGKRGHDGVDQLEVRHGEVHLQLF